MTKNTTSENNLCSVCKRGSHPDPRGKAPASARLHSSITLHYFLYDFCFTHPTASLPPTICLGPTINTFTSPLPLYSTRWPFCHVRGSFPALLIDNCQNITTTRHQSVYYGFRCTADVSYSIINIYTQVFYISFFFNSFLSLLSSAVSNIS